MLTSCEMGNYERNEYIYSSVRLKHTMYVILTLIMSSANFTSTGDADLY